MAGKHVRNYRVPGVAGLLLIVVLVAGRGHTAAEPDGTTANAGWEEMGVGSASGGGISNNSGYSSFPSLAIDSYGAPVVAWHGDSGSDVEIYVRRWNGAAWVEMGSDSASGGGISNNSGDSSFPALAIGLDGAPIITWLDNSGGGSSEIYVRRWNGAAWVEMGSGSASGGGISNTIGKSEDPFLIIGPDGAPIITWADDSGSDSGDYGIYLRRWNGAAWVEMGSGSASGYGISNNTNGWSGDPSLVIGSGGAPIITWTEEHNDDYEIYVRRWNGSTWAEMGSGSASDGGISNTRNGLSWHPSIAAGPDGAPIVAWYDYNIGNYEIYARRWNGSAWVEMSSGSASGGGISNNSSRSVQPSLAIGPDGAPIVAWYDESSTNSEIYVRRYQASCYTLTLTHSGSGSNPTANPLNSTGCAARHYTAGQAITLSASPAAGHHVKNWSGTANDSSTSTTNSLTMPAANHTVSVNYEAMPAGVFRAFMPSALNVPPTCFAGPNEREPNNNPADANGPLCPGLSFSGLPDDKWDIYYFETTLPGEIKATLTNHYGGGMQLQLYTGSVGGAPSYLDTDDGDGLQATLRGTQPGRYTIAVYTETPKPAETRRYILRVSAP